MKIKKTLFTLFAASLIISMSCITTSAFSNAIEFDDFENYKTIVGGDWKAQGRSTSLRVAKNGRGKSALLVSDSTKMQEMYRDFTPTDENTSSVAFGFSFKFDKSAAARALLTRTKENDREIALVTFNTNGGVEFGNKSFPNNTVKNGKWYNALAEVNFQTGFIRFTLSDSNSVLREEGKLSTSGIKNLFRMNFAQWRPGDGEAYMYVDNVFCKNLPYDSAEYISAANIQTFEDFVPNEQGTSAPDGFWLSNAEAEHRTLFAGTPPNSPYQKSLQMYTDATKAFELVRTTTKTENRVFLSFDMYYDNENAQIYVGLNGQSKDGGSVKQWPLRIKGGDVYLGTENHADYKSHMNDKLEAFKWYNYQLDFDIENNRVGITVKSSNGDIKLDEETDIILSPKFITEFRIYPLPEGGATTLYIDNFSVSEHVAAGIKSFSPQFGSIKTDCDTLKVIFSKKINTDNGYGDFYINGNSICKEKIQISENVVNINISDYLSPEKTLILEFENVNIDGKIISGINFYKTPNRVDIENFRFSKTKISPGELSCSVDLSCSSGEYKNMILLLALYDKATNRLVFVNYTFGNVADEFKSFETFVNVPDDEKAYRAVAYIWDSISKSRFIEKSIEIE